ncbi:hypothetical protein FA95DRAFT_121345 [Auriscalpium vulgare]|uniref:Uncharacterized protein n=1 Tax=Auriscalpium vulgare TaxID=40419 RepID=A0ACB8RPP7_9AGAM|nr:hypothetical protein FA95DRAFT_121345 [Auriscalpium vulgare]
MHTWRAIPDVHLIGVRTRLVGTRCLRSVAVLYGAGAGWTNEHGSSTADEGDFVQFVESAGRALWGLRQYLPCALAQSIGLLFMSNFIFLTFTTRPPYVRQFLSGSSSANLCIWAHTPGIATHTPRSPFIRLVLRSSAYRNDWYMYLVCSRTQTTVKGGR